MEVPKYIQKKILLTQELTQRCNKEIYDIMTWVESHGGDEFDEDFQNYVKDNCSYTYALDLDEFINYMKNK